jgi:toxin ParE1/3/4
MKYKFHPEALQEYGEATRWYAERDLKVAFRFIDAVEEAVIRIVENPMQWQVIDEDLRRCLTHVFSVRDSLRNRSGLHIDCGRDAL